ncbi:hypothetical protein [Crossiella cryophila]|uniref:Uncharacterized protein n=1 Tax=Crossiella cryophila TaxID=43355 RepID=A0A7W7CFB3_9PSEU|nr:hypothetical protein [Crossiella cryophila]MBB4680114.1 hypothetical protein [Crossiella cryophila]
MRTKRLSTVAGVGLLAIALSAVVLPGTASAADPVLITNSGGYSTQPSGTDPKDKVNRPLGAQVTIPAGQTRYLNSKLTVDNVREISEVSHLVLCRRPGQPAEVARLISGQNVLTGGATSLLTRGFVTAPADSLLHCEVYGQFVNHTANQPGRLEVMPSSYIQDMHGPTAAVRQTFNAKVLVNTKARVNSVSFTAPAGATAVQAISDLNVTVCYGEDEEGERKLCKRSLKARMDGRSSLVGTQLVMEQLAADGSVCKTTTNGDLAGVNVTTTIHHFKINKYLINVPIVANCSRDFVFYTRVTANSGSNSFVVEGNNQSVGAVFVP